ncbi:MAG TPA: hypothetical protein VHP83_25245 [Aggregatilineaceae bacterium]|nr:hypothetical protein [Aggregatilineaceae bacterium]
MNLEQVTQRVHRYRYLNGLAEVTIGGLCLLGALLLLAARFLLDALSPTSFLPLVVGVGVIALFVAGSLFCSTVPSGSANFLSIRARGLSATARMMPNSAILAVNLCSWR